MTVAALTVYALYLGVAFGPRTRGAVAKAG